MSIKALAIFLCSIHLAHASLTPTNRLNVRRPPQPKQVIVQMFEWSWDSIASECKNFIGPAGYGYVQVNPAQEHIVGSQWWVDYQAVSYRLETKRGSREQFANMVKACHAADVKVIADTIFNHMAGIESGVGFAGSSFTHYDYPGIYTHDDFHHCGTPGDDIHDFRSRKQVQTCELVNLADLRTETEHVRSRLAAHGNDLLSLGVDGFRLDAAKHMATTDIANILSRLSPPPGYITQEVVWGKGEEVQPSEYLGNGDVQEFRYLTAFQTSFLGGHISKLRNLEDLGWVPSGQANVFVANHDSERSGSSLSYKSPAGTYLLANILSLAHPYGTPTILSSYEFTNNDAGPPNNGAGTCSPTSGTNGWLCQHRWVAISGMVGFHNEVGSAKMTNWESPQGDRIAFGRGSVGFVAINNNDSDWKAVFSTSLPDGSYCDVVSGGPSRQSCTGATITVSNGKIATTVRPRSAFAVHAGSKRP